MPRMAHGSPTELGSLDSAPCANLPLTLQQEQHALIPSKVIRTLSSFVHMDVTTKVYMTVLVGTI